jgi:DNA-binding XRE family transcriptional regulator
VLPSFAFAAPIHPNAKRSPRTGKLPFIVEQHEKERANPSYRGQMEAARALLAQDMKEIGIESLSTLRLQRGYSQSQLAHLIGTSQPHIAKIEGGSVNPHWQTVVKLADALAVSLDLLRPFITTSSSVETKFAGEPLP